MDTREEMSATRKPLQLGDAAALFAVPAIVTLVHLLTNNRYGFHRDELQFLSDARHLDWGFVAYPPFTGLVEHLGLAWFGLSLAGLRIFSVLAQCAAVVLAGLMARELGGGRLAVVTATLAVALSPLPLFEGTEFQYTSFDFLWWVGASYCAIRMLKSENPRWWIAIGALVGMGLETKYSIVFFIAGILIGVALTPVRRQVKSAWFWAGILLALAIFLPNLIWLARHDFISYHFLQSIHARDVGEGRAVGFFRDQFVICASPAAAPLWIAGLLGYLRDRRYRMMALMFLVPVMFFYFAKGRGYYTAAAYPMLIAMGAVVGERWLGTLKPAARRTIAVLYFTNFAVVSAYICAILLPLAPDGPLREFALSKNGDLREEIGWYELTKTVAQIRDSLPPNQQASLGIVTGNYGEEGAMEIFGAAYQLPMPISMTNSGWLHGYPTPQPTTLIVAGFSRAAAERAFAGCRLAGHNGNSEGLRNEESEFHPDIFVCSAPREPWAEFWNDYQAFG